MGSGGGIYLYCRTFYGDTNGLLSAHGGNSGAGAGGAGGGGRIAVWRVFDRSTGVISNSVAGGTSANSASYYGTNGTVVFGWLPGKGTIVSAF